MAEGARAQLGMMIRRTPSATAMFDRTMRYIAASDRWVTEHGGGRTNVVGHDVLDGTPDPPEWWRYVQQHGLAGEALRKDEDAWVGVGGATRWVRWAIGPWIDESGAIGGIIVTIEDITDRKRTEQELRESEQKYTTIFERSPFAIVLVRWSDDTIVSANAAYLKLFECAREDLVGKGATDTGFADIESHAQVLNLLDQLGSVRDFEVTRVTKTGQPRRIALSLDWVMVGGEKHVLMTMRDITELKQAQDKARLYEQTKHLDEVKTRFFASVSHDLRTPLTLILAPAERLLGSPELTEMQRHDIAVITRNARTLLEHVNDLLDVSKLDAGRVTLDYIASDVAELVRWIAGNFESLAAERQIELVIDVPVELCADVDPEKLRRILLNLMSNAFKFTPGGGKVRVAARHADACVLIEVADSGPGVAPELRERIFQPFEQLRSQTIERFGRATGLGLAIARELAELHGGTIAVADAAEGGASFVVELPARAPPGALVAAPCDEPVCDAEAHSVVQVLHDTAPTRAAPVGTHGPLVLVVEDNPEMNQFITENLATDHRVANAYDGQDGLRKAIAMKPDLILTDIMMPVMSGDEMVRAIRERPELDAIPIVLLTAKADQELRVSMLRGGAQDYLHKPFAVDELRARIDNLIARKQAEERTLALQHQLEEIASASSDVSAAVASLPEASVRAVLHTIALRAQALTLAEYAAVGIGTDPAAPFEPWIVVGASPEAAAYGYPPTSPPMTSLLAVPITHQDRPLGTLYLANKRDGEAFSPRDERLVRMLAGRVGAAIETARLYRDEGMQRAWLQAVVDQMPDPVVLADGDGAIIAQNRAAVGFARPSGTIVLAWPNGQPLAPDDEPIARAIQHELTTLAQELVVRCADGREIPVLVSAAPIHLADGGRAGATMMIQDISTLKELERLREEWESIVAHDLQQPINAIVLHTELLESGGLPDKERERVAHVRALAMRLGRMVRDLSDASQLDAHRLAITRERLDVATVVREALEHQPPAGARTTLQVAGERSFFVLGDSGRLEQVLANLLSNAVKYSERDTPIVVEIAGVDDSVQVSVINEGAGISASELPHLFKRFARTRQARASAVKGTGLGLYIAKGIVEAHGGRIWVESEPGRTTAFRFTIPLAPELAEQPVSQLPG